MAESQPDLWIFAYGSLMWRPDFDFVQRQRAHLVGYRRALCIRSHVYRGTIAIPGLVFGLDRGGTCTGVAFQIAPSAATATLDAVRQRELVTGVYIEMEAEVQLEDGHWVGAIAYAADPTHEQYAGRLTTADQIEAVRRATGIAGPNLDYVLNTRDHLTMLGVEDDDLNTLCAALADCEDLI